MWVLASLVLLKLFIHMLSDPKCMKKRVEKDTLQKISGKEFLGRIFL